MVWVEVASVVAFVVMASVFCLPLPAVLRSSGECFARDHLLWIAPSDVEAVDRAHRVDFRLWRIALGTGLAVYAAGRLVAGPLAVLWIALATMATVASLLRLRQAGRDFGIAPGSPTVARSRAVRLRDYLPLQRLVVLGLCPVIAFGVALLGAAARDRGEGDLDMVLFVTVGGVVVGMLGVLIPVLAVAVVRRPLPASDRGHLYLQDAWRAYRLREMLWFETMAAITLLLQGHQILPEDGYIGLWLLPVSVVLCGFMLLTNFENLHFRRRLWPDLAPGERVVVGSAEPAGSAA